MLQVLTLANNFLCEKIIKKIIKKLQESTLDNGKTLHLAVSIYNDFGDVHPDMTIIKTLCTSYMKKEYAPLCLNYEKVKELSLDCLLMLIHTDEVSWCEKNIFQCIVMWLEHNMEKIDDFSNHY